MEEKRPAWPLEEPQNPWVKSMVLGGIVAVAAYSLVAMIGADDLSWESFGMVLVVVAVTSVLLLLLLWFVNRARLVLDDQGVLTISGTGVVWGYTDQSMTDGWENFLKDPFFKPLRGRQTAMDDQPVNITFRYEGKLLHPACSKGAPFQGPLTMGIDRVAGLGISQRRRNIDPAKKQPAIIPDDTHAAELLITEGLHFHHVFHNRLLLYSFVTSRMASPGRVDMIR